jgi:hypothetical protein
MDELLALGGDAARDELDGIRLSYAPPEGSKLLRERIGRFYGVDPDWVVVTTGHRRHCRRFSAWRRVAMRR